MKARIISLISGLIVTITILSFQLITRCNGIERNANYVIGTDLVGIVNNEVLRRIVIASIVIIAVSVFVSLLDRQLDRISIRKQTQKISDKNEYNDSKNYQLK